MFRKLKIVMLLALFGLATHLNAQTRLNPSGDWSAQTINSTQTVSLTGDVNLKGCITVSGSGVKLTIINETGSRISIFNKADLAHLFVVQDGATLEIEGGTRGITIGGGANYTQIQYDTEGFLKDENSLGEPSRTISNAPIDNNGSTLILNNLIIQNMCGSGNVDDYCGTIRHRGNGTTTITNCTITKCRSWTGAGVFVRPASDGTVTIENTTFEYCVNAITAHETHGGTIRAWGTAKAHVNLKNVTVHHCFSKVDAAVLYWPANGVNSDGNPATLTFDGCEFYKNKATDNAGALDLCGTVQFVNNVTKIHDNKAGTYGGGVSIRPYNSGSPAPHPLDVVYDITDKMEIYGNKALRGGGVAFYSDGAGSTLPAGTNFIINLDGALVHNNQATDESNGNGGGIWLNNLYTGTDFTFTFNMNKGSVYENTAKAYGGGIYLSGWKIVSSTDPSDVVKIYDNQATESGGGMYISSGADYTMNNGEIYGNTTQKGGGGIFMQSGNFTLNQGSISSNTAKNNGGGLYVANGNVTLKEGSISNNVAQTKNGGGFYLGGGNIKIAGGSVRGNISSQNGGGVYIQNAEKIELQNGTVKENKAANGGGFYMTGSNVTINGITVSDNTATQNGGGIAIYTPANIKNKTVMIGKGTIEKNTAGANGGGLYISGINKSNTLSGTSYIQNNQALNGGGIFMEAGAKISIEGGFIRNNKAVAAKGASIDTAYHSTPSSGTLQGVGGGVYLASGTSSNKTSLIFSDIKKIGLYLNEADLAGDDIVTDANNTTFSVPSVEGMNLDEYPGRADGWYEDYADTISGDVHSGDSKYSYGTDQITTAGEKNRRYRESSKYNIGYKVPQSVLEAKTDGYLCLTLGYTPLMDLIISKSGMKEGETAIFKVSKSAAGSPVLYTIPVTAKSNGSGSTTINGLDVGEYTVTEITDWSWAYTPDPASGKITQNIGEKNTFTFKNTPKKDIPVHAETNVNNKLEKKTN